MPEIKKDIILLINLKFAIILNFKNIMYIGIFAMIIFVFGLEMLAKANIRIVDARCYKV